MRHRLIDPSSTQLESLEPRILLSAVFTEFMTASGFSSRWDPINGGGTIVRFSGDDELRFLPLPGLGVASEVARSFYLEADADFSMRFDWRELALNHAGNLRQGLVLNFTTSEGDATPLSLQVNVVSGDQGGSIQWVLREGDATQRIVQSRTATEGTLFLWFDRDDATFHFSTSSFDTPDASLSTSLSTDGLVVVPRLRGQWTSEARAPLPTLTSALDNYVIETGHVVFRPDATLTRLSPVGSDSPLTAKRIEPGTPREVLYLLRNTGLGPLEIDDLFFSRNDLNAFSLVHDITGPLAPGHSAQVTLRIAPEVYQSEYIRATLERRQDGREPASLSSFVAALLPPTNPDAPDLYVLGTVRRDVSSGEIIEDGDRTPRHLDGTRFGGKLAGAFVERTYRLYNASTGTLLVSSVRIVSETGGFVVSPSPFSVPPGAGIEVTVTFVAGSPGVYTGIVEFATNDPDSPVYDFRVRGNVQADPERLLIQGRAPGETLWRGIENGSDAPRLVNGTRFGPVMLGEASNRVFRLVSGPTVQVFTITQIRIVGDDQAFRVQFDRLNSSILRGDDATFTVDLLALSSGLKQARVEISWLTPGFGGTQVASFDIRGTVV